MNTEHSRFHRSRSRQHVSLDRVATVPRGVRQWRAGAHDGPQGEQVVVISRIGSALWQMVRYAAPVPNQAPVPRADGDIASGSG